ncbi:MAG TPA: PIN domain-containing protein [Aldersonia sp.]
MNPWSCRRTSGRDSGDQHRAANLFWWCRRGVGRRVRITYLLDANVLIALTVAEHEHHERASAWAATISRFAVCPIVEGALVRFLVRTGEGIGTAVSSGGRGRGDLRSGGGAHSRFRQAGGLLDALPPRRDGRNDARSGGVDAGAPRI